VIPAHVCSFVLFLLVLRLASTTCYQSVCANNRLFGPERTIGGIGDIGARIGAEIARTGLSDDEIGAKVNIFHIMSVDGLANVVYIFFFF
jgi:hypothetical protein